MSTRTSLRTLASITTRSASTSTSTLPSPPPSSVASASTSTSSLSLSSSSSQSQARIYPPRKAFLHAYYGHLLRTSQLVLLFSHDNLTVSNLLSIRRAIAKIPPPPVSGSTLSTTIDPAEPQKATLTIARTGLLSSLFKPSSSDLPSLLPYLEGPTALITSPSLSPTYLSKLLSSINRSIRKSQKEAPANTPSEKVKQPKLQLAAGILEGGRLVGVKEVEQVGKLPELEVLRAQVVGLLEGQGRGLLGVLSQAGGGGLVRTLQGLEEGLKKDSQEKA